MSPECNTPEQSIRQHPNPQPTSRPSPKPDPTNPNPLYLLAEAAELSSLPQEDLAAASILLQLHREDALLANSNPSREAKTISPDTDSDATIPDDTPYRSVVGGGDGGGQQNQEKQQRPPGSPSSSSSSSPAEKAAARRGGKRKREVRMRRGPASCL
ncbi:hypothetical protein EPUS_08434 [Endocarpon pusillum Z07020]|uniref:Uncharacterized protein n=1 Tax=Endocarpon pusillum (strain Z07020 / HMAS-L-300199) TaxID=1263415 RepID=U1I0W5_ENDPU|nr:uncharacterized protein EPUS_08434 [Endocarpon pusillum Z07020]ERF75529.1 hypothetical protein EPUS_08434 [Endocarpon pusillum Z07020]